MQIIPNVLPLVSINAPEIYADEAFCEWLNAVAANGRRRFPGDRIATWHWPGHAPSERSDIFMTVDGPDGSDSDMPKHCWEMILEAVHQAVPDPCPECVVWLTNLNPEDFGMEGFTLVATRTAPAPGSRLNQFGPHTPMLPKQDHDWELPTAQNNE